MAGQRGEDIGVLDQAQRRRALMGLLQLDGERLV
jgi:hypothetical protein